jgi:hypothetical protein
VAGLDLIAPVLGSEVAVIPHYNNAEGGNHDTRFCYLGEPRLARLEEQMPQGGWVLGVDEHTGCFFDLDASMVSVVGNGTVTVRRRGVSAVVEPGEPFPIGSLADMARGQRTGRAVVRPSVPDPIEAAPPTVLHGEIRRLEEGFDRALEARDVAGAVRSALELIDTLEAWSGDTTQSDAGERGQAALRRMVVRLGDLALTGTQDPKELFGGYVEALLAERAAARSSGRYADADRVRDVLVANGIEVHDTPDGTSWSLAEA